jgi:hypothetical protein
MKLNEAQLMEVENKLDSMLAATTAKALSEASGKRLFHEETDYEALPESLKAKHALALEHQSKVLSEELLALWGRE